jgi:hypothetical protein
VEKKLVGEKVRVRLMVIFKRVLDNYIEVKYLNIQSKEKGFKTDAGKAIYIFKLFWRGGRTHDSKKRKIPGLQRTQRNYSNKPQRAVAAEIEGQIPQCCC